MANLRDIRRRISSVKSTQQITRAMKMVSAAKLRRAQERMEAARPFAGKIAEVIASLAERAEPGAHPLIQAAASEEAPAADAGPAQGETTNEAKITLAVVSADRGLCGSFNSNVLRMAYDYYQEQHDAAVTLLTIGRKAGEFFSRRDAPIVERHDDFFRGFEYSHAQRLGDSLKQRFLDGEADAVYLVFNKFRSMFSQAPVMMRLLPVVPPPAPFGIIPYDFIYEPSRTEVLNSLLERYVNTQVYQALLESSTGEFAARMTAMDSATTNAEEMIGTLTLFYNRARQAAITRELIEVVSGADALAG